MKSHVDFPSYAIKKTSDSSLGEGFGADDFTFLRDFQGKKLVCNSSANMLQITL